MFKVSIQIPTFNQEKDIERCIYSALLQSYENIEVVVLDDNSSDNTFLKCNAIKNEKLKVFRNNTNIGRANTYKKLLYDLTNGDYTVNLDGDDYFLDKNFIKNAILSISSNENIVFYQSNQYKINRAIQFYKYKKLNENNILLNGMEYLKQYPMITGFSHMGCLYNRTLALKCNFYNSNSLIIDFCSVMRLCKFGNIILNNERTGFWNFNPSSETNKQGFENQYALNINAIEELFTNYTNFNSKSEKQNIFKQYQKLIFHLFSTAKIKKATSFSEKLKTLINTADFSLFFIIRMIRIFN